MVKVRTVLTGTFGSYVNFRNEKIEFSSKGVAEVEESVAKDLIHSFPNAYYLDGEQAPSLKKKTPPPPVEADFRTKFAEGNSEKALSLVAKEQERAEKEMKAKVREELREELLEQARQEAREELLKEQEAASKQTKQIEEDVDKRGPSQEDEGDNEGDDESENKELEQEDQHAAIREELDKEFTVKELKALIESSGNFEEEVYSTLKKPELINFVIKNELV